MIEPRIVRRYAAALFRAASAAGVVDRVESDLGLVSYAVETAPSLLEAVSSPLVPSGKKKDVVREIFADKVHEITLAYLYLLVDKRREEAVVQTEAEYIRLANEARGILGAHAVSAVKLTPDEEAGIVQKLAVLTGKKINLERSVDPSLIAGVLIRIGDTIIDGSVKGQLEALRGRLLE